MGPNTRNLDGSVTGINNIQNLRPTAIWTFQDRNTLVEELLRAKLNGSAPENDFDTEIWSTCSKNLIDPLKTPWECKKEWWKMKVEYLEVKEIRQHKEFKWAHSRLSLPNKQRFWAVLTGGRPELLKWRFTNFQWFESMDEIFGGVVYKTNGNRYAIRNGSRPVLIEEDEEGQEEESATPAVTTSTKSTPRDVTGRYYDDDDDAEVIAEARCQPQKRRADPTTITRPSKRTKTSSGPVITSNAIDIPTAPPQTIQSKDLTSNLVPQERVDSTISGQAQLKIQKEACLTPLGTVEMLDLLADPARARTYMAIETESLRRMWIEKQLRGLALGVACMKELFIEMN